MPILHRHRYQPPAHWFVHGVIATLVPPSEAVGSTNLQIARTEVSVLIDTGAARNYIRTSALDRLMAPEANYQRPYLSPHTEEEEGRQHFWGWKVWASFEVRLRFPSGREVPLQGPLLIGGSPGDEGRCASRISGLTPMPGTADLILGGTFLESRTMVLTRSELTLVEPTHYPSFVEGLAGLLDTLPATP